MQSAMTAVDHFALTMVPLKQKYKKAADTKWEKFYKVVTSTDRPIEVQCRILRAFRLKLVHEYCLDLAKELYSETIPL